MHLALTTCACSHLALVLPCTVCAIPCLACTPTCFLLYICAKKRARMDQRLIAIVVVFGFRFVLLAIPVLGNFWLRTMIRRIWGWCSSGSEASSSSMEEGEGEQQIVQLQVMMAEQESPRRRHLNPRLELALPDSEEDGISIVM